MKDPIVEFLPPDQVMPDSRRALSQTASQHTDVDADSIERSHRSERKITHEHLLLLRFALLNLAGFALLSAAWLQGWVAIASRADSTYLSHAIFALFLVGFFICGARVWRTSRELDKAKRFDPRSPEPSLARKYMLQICGRGGESRSLIAAGFRLKASSRIAIVRVIANLLVLMGLIGTVLGFILALGGVDPQTASDADAITPMVQTLIQGMSVALYTTLIGAVLNIWLMVNYQILLTGTINLVTAVVTLGESRSQAA